MDKLLQKNVNSELASSDKSGIGKDAEEDPKVF